MILRVADDGDKDLFYRLRAEPLVARVSRRGEITKAEHDRWWKGTTDHRFVADWNGAPAGVMRIGVDGTVSIIVCPELRGTGMGPSMLKLLAGEARKLGFQRLWAEIAPENVASQRAFIKAGWAPILLELAP